MTTANVPGMVIEPNTRSANGSGAPMDCRLVPIIQMRSQIGSTANW